MGAEVVDAIVVRNASKQFRKSTVPKRSTTFKTELVRWLRGQRQEAREMWIEVLRSIDLTVPKGRTVGIIGRNGAGKSTLLKMITGIYTPTTGTVTVNGRVSALLDLGAGFHPDFSGRENILINSIILGMTRSEVKERMPEIIAFSELGDFIDEPVRTYSSGMYMRLAFSVATHVNPDILIIDEILAVGDEHFSHKSRAKMNDFKKAGKTIVLVTHDLGTVERWCDEAVWIDGGRSRLTGTPSMVASEYRRAVMLEERREANRIPSRDGGSDGKSPGEGPTAEPSAPIRIEGVHLANCAPPQVVVLGPEDPLEVRIHFSARNGSAEVGFRIRLSRSDGLTIYDASTFADPVALPRPLPPNGRLHLQIHRLGLAAGTYSVDVTAESPGGRTYDARLQACSFRVDSAQADRGIINLPHRWLIDSSPLPPKEG